jgi:hypothetical protein
MHRREEIGIMRRLWIEDRNRVQVCFAGASLNFGLPRRATFQNLAEAVGRLARWYDAKPILIAVRRSSGRR